MATREEWETTDVLIVGCGPTGALLTALLSNFEINNIALEQQPEITEDPRGITLDEDGIRMLQGVGLYDKIYTEIGSSLGMIYFITSKTDLHETPFLKFNLDTTEGGTGHVGVISQRQPILEKHLRHASSGQSYSTLRSSCTVTQIEEDGDWVYCQYQDGHGDKKNIRARFLVGADGKTGFTRKMYLEPKGILMAQISTFGYNEIWVALNIKVTPPTPETHPKLPFWDLGYTSEQVYDLYFPKNFRFICNGERPVVCGRFGTGAENLWRLEFVVQREEDAALMATDAKTMEIVMPYLRHAGKKYGIRESVVEFPLDCLTILRARPFTFSARSCNKWSEGRVMLAGDSAHVFPPFGGQGIASGFRDASGLAWRLAIAIREKSNRYEYLLAGWYNERQQQLQESLRVTIKNGSLCTEGNTWKFVILKLVFRCMQLIPPLNRILERGPRNGGMIRYKWQHGLPFLENANGGISLPQVYCCPLSPASNAGVSFTDDIIFRKDKKGIFQLLVLLDSVTDLELKRSALVDLDRVSGGYVLPHEASFIVQTSTSDASTSSADLVSHSDIFRLATGEEFASSESLCRGRPVPQYYDMYQMRRSLGGMSFAIVRPDRFVYAACDSPDELRSICGSIRQTLGLC